MNRGKFETKYIDAVVGIYNAGGKVDDTSVCVDKLISSVKGHFGETFKDGTGEHVFDVYEGIPEDFDWDGAYADYQEMIKG